MKLAILSAFMVSGALLAAVPASASPIEYIFTGTADGNLAGAAFTDAHFTITEFGNTSTVTFSGNISARLRPPTFRWARLAGNFRKARIS